MTRKILKGGKAIAQYMYGDNAEACSVYRLSEAYGLPTFKLGGSIAARPEKLDAWLAKQEADSEMEAA